jgi:D-inositol-3-phosphate glycosyltransferase
MGDRRTVAERGREHARPGRVAIITMHTSPTATLGQEANGGLNVYVRELCALFSRRGVATDVFTRCLEGDCPSVEDLTDLSRVVYLPAGRPGLDKYRLLDQVPAFTDAVQDFVEGSDLRYDLIYSHYWLSGLVACALRRRLCLPWAHTAHTLALVKNRQLAPGAEPEPEIRVDLEGEISRCADLLVVSTEAEGDELRRAYHVPRDRIAVVAPGVDLDAFRPQPRAGAREQVGRPDDRLFVFAGRLEPLKGVDVALRALALLGDRHPSARLLVLGDDSGAGERARLRRLADELGLGDRVEFLGSVPQQRLATYYAAAEACLMPSYSESFGLVGLEAQACGTPVIASNVDGLASVVRDGVTGFLVDGHRPDDYAERMGRILDSPRLAVDLGEHGSRQARAFSWERTADRLLDRFGELLAVTPALAQAGVQATSRQE